MLIAYCALRRAPGMDGWALASLVPPDQNKDSSQIGPESLWISDWFVLGITEGGSHELGALHVLIVVRLLYWVFECQEVGSEY